MGRLHHNSHHTIAGRLAGSFRELIDQLSSLELSAEWHCVPSIAAIPIPEMITVNHICTGMTDEERQELESMRQHEQQLCEQLDK